MSPLHSTLFFCSLLGLSSLASADTIFLSSGDKVEGKILNSTDASVEVQVAVSSGISDVRTISRTDILRIEKPDPALLAYDEIKTLQPGPNSLPVAEYDRILFGRLKPFLTKYPLNANTANIQKAYDGFAAEKARVQKGELKINQRWFTSEEVEKNKVELGATVLFQQMQTMGGAGDVIGALNQFATLEKNYKGARVYPEAVQYARSLMPVVRRDIEAKNVLLNRDLADRKQGLALTPEYRRADLLAATRQEEADTNSQLDAAKRAGLIWTPIYPRSKRSIDDLTATLESESKRLEGLPVDDMTASIKASEEGRELLAKGDVKGAQDRFADARKLWTDNAMMKDDTELLAAATKPTPVPAVAAASAQPAVAKTPPRVARTPLPRAAVAPEPEKKPFLLSLPGIVLIVVMVAGIAIFSMTAKSRKKGDISI